MEAMSAWTSPRARSGDDDAIRITTAPVSREADTAARQRRYLLSMAIRTLCFVGAVLIGPGWARWVLVAGAVFLPYVAVVMANAAAPRREALDLPGGDPDVRRLGGAARRSDDSLS